MEGRGNGPAHSEVSSTKEEPGDGTDLELGLSLGTKNRASGNTAGLRPRLRGDCCRILTAEDLGSRSPRSSSSSVSSSSSATPPSGGGRGAGCPPSSHGVVGWPPIRTYRMNSLANHTKDNTSDTETSACKRASICYSEEPNRHDDHESKKGFVASSFFVKVNMDGVPIGRKIDLNAHLSYDTLALVLEVMFSSSTTTFCTSPDGLKASKLLDGSSEFTLTYEDKDGDWMLVGDVPWRMFLNTVKRLRIMRTADANGLAPRLDDDCKDVVPASKQA